LFKNVGKVGKKNDWKGTFHQYFSGVFVYLMLEALNMAPFETD